MTRLLAVVLLVGFVAGCDQMPGKPDPKVDKWQPPTAETSFHKIYAESCMGCHGQGGKLAGSMSLDNAVYLSILPPETLREIIANGVPGTAMPAFAQSNGGLLTEEQIDILVQGIMAWTPKPPLAGPLPAYVAEPGDATAGEAIYQTYLATVAKAAGPGAVAGGFYTNPAFLGLVSDQYLRTLIIAGRPELGVPDFRTALDGQPLSEQNIADLVAWLISQRRNEFGQPLPPGQR
jgi:cytochrome c oxidase cbb3-type subunit III